MLNKQEGPDPSGPFRKGGWYRLRSNTEAGMGYDFDEYEGVWNDGDMARLCKGWWLDAMYFSLSCPEGGSHYYPANLLGFFLKNFGGANRERHGETLLMAAASAGRMDCIEVLLMFGADWKRKNRGGRTAEDLAVEAGHSGAAGILAALRERPVIARAATRPCGKEMLPVRL